MPGTISIGGPVEEIGGQLMLRIPLDAGGRDLAPFARGIGAIEGDFLIVVIKPWLAEKLVLFPGSSVIVDNDGGRFNIRSNDPVA